MAAAAACGNSHEAHALGSLRDPLVHSHKSEDFAMDFLRWTLIFLVLALVSAAFGFGGLAANFAYIGKILFFIFLILFIVGLFFGRGRGRTW